MGYCQSDAMSTNDFSILVKEFISDGVLSEEIRVFETEWCGEDGGCWWASEIEINSSDLIEADKLYIVQQDGPFETDCFLLFDDNYKFKIIKETECTHLLLPDSRLGGLDLETVFNFHLL